MALIGGFVVMYETQALWGLEDNPNAATINATFNNVPALIPIAIIVVIVIAGILITTTYRAF